MKDSSPMFYMKVIINEMNVSEINHILSELSKSGAF